MPHTNGTTMPKPRAVVHLLWRSRDVGGERELVTIFAKHDDACAAAWDDRHAAKREPGWHYRVTTEWLQ